MKIEMEVTLEIARDLLKDGKLSYENKIDIIKQELTKNMSTIAEHEIMNKIELELFYELIGKIQKVTHKIQLAIMINSKINRILDIWKSEKEEFFEEEILDFLINLKLGNGKNILDFLYSSWLVATDSDSFDDDDDDEVLGYISEAITGMIATGKTDYILLG